MTALAAGARPAALVVAAHALDAADCRLLLDTLGLLTPSLPVVQPRPVLNLPRHGSRSGYVRGCHCPRCTTANALYVARWRRRRCCTRPVVTHRPIVVVLDHPAGHGRHRAWPGQLALALEGEAA